MKRFCAALFLFSLTGAVSNASVIYSFSQSLWYTDDNNQNGFVGTLGFTLTQPTFLKAQDNWFSGSQLSSCQTVYDLPCTAVDLSQTSYGIALDFHVGEDGIDVIQSFNGLSLEALGSWSSGYGFEGCSQCVETFTIVDPVNVPEPGTWGLLGLGFAFVLSAVWPEQARRRLRCGKTGAVDQD